MNTFKNKVQLIDGLGKDPESINLENRKTIAKSSIATNENCENAECKKITTIRWHHIVDYLQHQIYNSKAAA